jgi:hypothetical protein
MGTQIQWYKCYCQQGSATISDAKLGRYNVMASQVMLIWNLPYCGPLRHYVNCRNCRSKFYVSTQAKARSDLPFSFNLTCPVCKQTLEYYNTDVYAEASNLGGAGGALLGGLVGLAAGGIGAIIGALAGAALGEKYSQQDTQEAERFNSS